jgi:hypothetical protein
MAHYVVCPQKKNNIPHFQNQRCINSYFHAGLIFLISRFPHLSKFSAKLFYIAC